MAISIIPHGAARMVTGSCYEISLRSAKILVDCGMFQGGKLHEEMNREPFAFDPREIHSVILTHAHLDHTGLLPRLIHEGFSGPIYCTPATKELTTVILRDSAKIQREDLLDYGERPLYNESDVEQTLSLIKTIPFGSAQQLIQLNQPTTFEFFQAGHILGAASILIKTGNKRILFSGDLGYPHAPITVPPEPPAEADVVIMESTYGGVEHESKVARRQRLKELIRIAKKNKSIILMPAFAVERTQDLLYELNYLMEFDGLKPIPVFVDSPMATTVTGIYHAHQSELAPKVQELLMKDTNPFDFPKLQFTPHVAESKAISRQHPPFILIAASGMATGGRIVRHLSYHLSNKRNIVFFTGYQVNGSLGRQILDGKPNVKINGRHVAVNAQIFQSSSYSAHADHRNLLDWLGQVSSVKKVILTHGDYQRAQTLQKEIEVESIIPDRHEEIKL